MSMLYTLRFTDQGGNSQVLGTGDSVDPLQGLASGHYEGEEILIWQTEVVGKDYGELAPETPCFVVLEDGSAYSISGDVERA